MAPKTVATTDMYKGVMPFVGVQLLMLGLLAVWPELATWLPELAYGGGEAVLNDTLQIEQYTIDF